MLTHLRIENFALIPFLELDFRKGLSVMTGETGSGKSILLGALNLILGERADLNVVRDTQKKTIVEGVFDCSSLNLIDFFADNDLDFDTELVIRRELAPGGKSRAFINDTPVQLTLLKELTEQLIHIHSQHHVLELKKNSFQFDVLDYLADAIEVRTNFQSTTNILSRKKHDLQELSLQLQKLKQDASYVDYQLTELKALTLSEVDYEVLEQELSEISNYESLKSTVFTLQELMDGDQSILSVLQQIKTVAEKNQNLHPFFEEFNSRIKATQVELKELSFDLSNFQDKLSFNPNQKAKLEEQLSAYHTACMKHGVQGQKELEQLQVHFENQHASTDEIEIEIQSLSKEIKELEKIQLNQAEQLHHIRIAKKDEIETQLVPILSRLKMNEAKVKFDIHFTNQPNQFGFDELNLLFSPNPGLEAKPIDKVASGGELSRMMLAIHLLLSRKKALPTMIFDEIDTGVSGEVADKLGLVLKEMGGQMQLVAITHLPQVASKGTAHLKVEKFVQNQQTFSKVFYLSQDERIQEIARLMSGENINEAALRHAKELMN